MKRTGYLFEKITDLENIKEAARKASLGKRHQVSVQRILNNLDHYATKIKTSLENKTYTPSPYITKTIVDGTAKKEREISKPRFYPDQIIHWAIMLQVEPLFMKGMYHYNCGSIKGRGSNHGQKAIRKWLDKDLRNTKYCLKLDISKFYPSVSNSVLKSQFRRVIKDNKTLDLMDAIVDSAQGLPIGNYTSQWFANFYLTGLDHFIKKQKGAKHYIRYVDDFVILGPNKRHLHKLLKVISGFLVCLGLSVKGNWQVFKMDSRPLDFLGFRFYRNRTTLRRKTSLRIRRRAEKIGKKLYINQHDAAAIISYWGWIKRSNSYGFYTHYIKKHVSVNHCRKVVSNYAKANHRGSCTKLQPMHAICR
jgi:RNA-directed DNA polymerase